MRRLLSLLALLACWSSSAAASPALGEGERVVASVPHPPVEPAPQITIRRALDIGTAFAAKKRPDISQFYVDRVWLDYNPRNNKRCWIISFASPKLLYFFVAVYMDGRAAIPKGGRPFQPSYIIE